MSGVVDDKGQQWEHCHTCGEFVKFPQNLGYRGDNGNHICLACVNKLPQAELEAVIPAPSWVPQFEDEEPNMTIDKEAHAQLRS